MAQLFGISTESIVARFERLSDRERKMSVLFLVVALIVVVGGGLYWIIDNGNQLRNSIEAMETGLEKINRLKDPYVNLQSRKARFENNRITNLRSFIDSKAKSLGLPTNALAEAKDVAMEKITPENLKLEVAKFSIGRVSIDMLTAFLQSIEGSERDGAVKVTQLKVTVSDGAPDLLDASMTVATWKRKA